ncbi:unnamed protein product [Ixodes persulcatus]
MNVIESKDVFIRSPDSQAATKISASSGIPSRSSVKWRSLGHRAQSPSWHSLVGGEQMYNNSKSETLTSIPLTLSRAATQSLKFLQYIHTYTNFSLRSTLDPPGSQGMKLC